ncbi:unnamed protein product [marine sediment metagenome]|uniref:Uncharacterized protein n=1 Tax=marine sediment metagenome TaxID=412755 RepID=X0UBV0_9ZZZZ
MRARTINETFDVLTWSKANLPKYIYTQIESVHDGAEGKSKQNSLLKVINKDELMDWFNRNFELGSMDFNEE